MSVLFQITDRATLGEEALFDRVRRAAAPLAIQVRDKDLDEASRFDLARRLLAAARPLGHRVIMGGAFEHARGLDVDGVHLVASRAREIRAAKSAFRFVSVACHDPSEVERAAGEGADAVLVSPVFASPGKGAPVGLAALEQARAVVEGQGASCSVVALGGIDPSNANACLAAGAHAVAAIRADLVAWARALGSTLT